ncbi:MAG TPA: KpsF/GutQ family sugar-phosphate isomerase [Gemmatimonadales bacterium]|nr:KpsF/GutQ family sugar-phosphate isomerase [Gemmatimonadales bacterium]
MIDLLASARRTLALEGEAIQAASDRLDDRFADAVAILASAERVVVSGIGKSGAIAQKIAGTLTSTGTFATWLHPVESLHGDLGIVTHSSAAIILSKSGETDELFGMLAALTRLEVPIIALTGVPDSTLGRAASVVLDASVREEACPHGLAPTSSTTVALALGDALAVALLQQKGFGPEDFAALHPGGRLGRRLLLRVADVMVAPDYLLPTTASMRQVVVSLAHGRGLAVLVDEGQLAGVITAGDLTRLIDTTDAYLQLPAADVMTRQPHVLRIDDLGATAVGRMERAGIVAAPVLDATDQVVGVVHLHDLLRAGVA